MFSGVTSSQLAYRHIAVICLSAVVTIWGLAVFAGISFWPTFWATAVFCSFACGYVLTRHPIPATEFSTIDHSLREQARLADGFHEALVIINKREEILYANPAAKTLFGLIGDDNNVADLIQDLEVLAIVKETLSGGTPDPVTLHRETPVEQHIRVMTSGIYSEEETGVIQRAIIVFYDITDLVRVDTMRADFLANASHELKTPLASLMGYIETLRGHAKDDPEAQAVFLGIMQQQAERMQRLINDLLSLRRIEIVEHLAPEETADLYLATRAAMDAVKPLAKNLGVKIKYNGPKEALVVGIQDKLVQLVLNILDNAMLVTPEKGSIDLSLEIMDEWQAIALYSNDAKFEYAPRREIVSPIEPGRGFAVLRIKDKGPGFAPEHLPRIGERFYKIEGHTNREKQGTGLGLAIVKHIMRRHRGGLFIESAEGVGTIFTILLPLPPAT